MKLLLEQFDIEENKDLLKSMISQQLEADDSLAAIPGQNNFLADTYKKISSQIFLK